MRASGSGMAKTLQCTDVGLQPASIAGVGVVVGVGVAVGVGCVVVAPLSLLPLSKPAQRDTICCGRCIKET